MPNGNNHSTNQPGQSIFDDTGYLSMEMMQAYLDGSLSARDRHFVERQLENSPLDRDAMEGLQAIYGKDKDRFAAMAAALNQKVDAKVKGGRIISLNYRSVAAIAAVFLMAVTGIWYIRSVNKSKGEEVFSDYYQKYPAEDNSLEFPRADSSRIPPANAMGNNGIISDLEPPMEDDIPDEAVLPENNMPDRPAVKPIEGISYESIEEDNATYSVPTSSNTDKRVKELKQSAEEVSIMDSEMAEEKSTDDIQTVSTSEKAASTTYSSGNNNYGGRSAKNDQMQADAEDLLTRAMTYYGQKQYEETVNILEYVIKQDPANQKAWFYLGQSYLELNESKKAIDAFDEVLNVISSPYYADAEWYKALALVKRGKKNSAQELLGEIVRKKGKYATQAQEVLNDL